MNGTNKILRGKLKSTEEIKELLKTIDYAIFDFDNTLYPGMFLFDLAQIVFKSHKDFKKLENLQLLAKTFKNNRFAESYLGFIKLLDGEEVTEFVSASNKLIKNAYDYAFLTIKILNESYNIKTCLVSVTADFVANVAKTHFNLNEAYGINYLTSDSTEKNKFIGITKSLIDSSYNMKIRMLKSAHISNFSKIHFFDDVNDLDVVSDAILKVGVNPTLDLEKNLDIVLNKQGDPWKDFYNLIN